MNLTHESTNDLDRTKKITQKNKQTHTQIQTHIHPFGRSQKNLQTEKQHFKQQKRLQNKNQQQIN